jgi:hypothetical protein
MNGMKHRVRLLLMAALPAALCCGSPAFAQLDYIPEVNDMSTAPIGATSPLGVDSSSSVGGSGIPLGATEIKSAGVSPLATYSTGTIALPASGTTCATSASQPGLAGPADTYDGGGMTMGSAATATAGIATMTVNATASASTAPTDPGTLPISGTSTAYAAGTVGVTGMCSATSSGLAASPSSPTSTTPIAPGGNPRTGIPLASSEIANLGVSSWATIPTPSVSPLVATPGTMLPTIQAMPAAITTPLSTPASTTTAPPSLAASMTGNVSGIIQSSTSGIPILVPGLAGK